MIFPLKNHQKCRALAANAKLQRSRPRSIDESLSISRSADPLRQHPVHTIKMVGLAENEEIPRNNRTSTRSSDRALNRYATQLSRKNAFRVGDILQSANRLIYLLALCAAGERGNVCKNGYGNNEIFFFFRCRRISVIFFRHVNCCAT